MLVILGQGGLAPGGVNFDAKVRRESFEPVDLFHAHIGGMDAFAHGPQDRRQDPRRRRAARTSSSSATARGTAASARRSRRAGEASRTWRSTCSRRATPTPNVSGRQEMLENVVNRYLRLTRSSCESPVAARLLTTTTEKRCNLSYLGCPPSPAAGFAFLDRLQISVS